MEPVGIIIVVVVAALVTASISRAVTNPITNIVDELISPTSYAEVATLLGGTRGCEFRTVLPGTYTLSYRRTPAWAFVLGILTFPLGLLLIWFVRERLSLMVAVTAVDVGNRITVVGQAHTKVARGLGSASESAGSTR